MIDLAHLTSGLQIKPRAISILNQNCQAILGYLLADALAESEGNRLLQLLTAKRLLEKAPERVIIGTIYQLGVFDLESQLEKFASNGLLDNKELKLKFYEYADEFFKNSGIFEETDKK